MTAVIITVEVEYNQGICEVLFHLKNSVNSQLWQDIYLVINCEFPDQRVVGATRLLYRQAKRASPSNPGSIGSIHL